MDRGTWLATVHGATESATTEQLTHCGLSTALAPPVAQQAAPRDAEPSSPAALVSVQTCWEPRCVGTEVPRGVRRQEEKGEAPQESPCV